MSHGIKPVLFAMAREPVLTILWCLLACALAIAIVVVCGTRGRYYTPHPSARPHCGLVAVETICRLHNVETNPSEIYLYAGVTEKGTTLLGCKRALEAKGFGCRAIECLSTSDLPEGVAILGVFRAKESPHAVVLIRNAARVIVLDGPVSRTMNTVEADKFFGGNAIVASWPSTRGDTGQGGGR